jgi:hypothetical protein
VSTPLTDQLRVYFDEVDRQQGAVDIGALRRSVEQEVFTIELAPDTAVPPNGPTSGRRWPILIVAAAAVVLVVGALVVFDDDDATPADQPSLTATAPPTVAPRALRKMHDEAQLARGTYFVDEVSKTPTPRIFVTIGTGWKKQDFGRADLTIYKIGKSGGGGDGDGLIMFSRPGAVYSDACHWEAGYHPGPVDTLDGLVAALTQQHGWAEVTAPSDISVDGYAGKAFQRTAPADMSDCDDLGRSPRLPENRGSSFLSWDSQDGEYGTGGTYEPDQIETLWVLDIDGSVVVINARPYPEATAAAHAEFAAVLDSIRIARA